MYHYKYKLYSGYFCFINGVYENELFLIIVIVDNIIPIIKL
jgi:hypothetical protein